MTRKYRIDFSMEFNADDMGELDAATLDDERTLSQLAAQCVAYERDYELANDVHGDY